MKLSEMRQLLSEEGIRLTKSMGQSFLHDGNQLRRIAAAAGLTRHDAVLEIGPGLGVLTELLVERAGEVLAVEKDARLIPLLRRQLAAHLANEASHSPVGGSTPPAITERGLPNLRLLQDDALDWLKREPRDWSGWKLVANLPYSIASPLLVELARGLCAPQQMVVTLQAEVAKRLMASPGQKDYGVLTLLVQLDFAPSAWFKIPARCFFPQPEVDSACVCLIRRPQPVLPPEQRAAFRAIVKRGFSQRRKVLLKLLREDWPDDALAQAYTQAGLAPQTRAEQVPLAGFMQLAQSLHGWSSPSRTERKQEIFDVVNERDEVVGRQPRGEVHRLGLRHRAIHVLLFNSQGQVFLQKRSMKKDRQPGLWDSSTSGHVDSGEDYDAAAMRELREEIGLRLPHPPRRLFQVPAAPETDQEFVWVYQCRSDDPLELNPDEIERGDWLSPEELTRRLAERPFEFASSFRVIWGRWNNAKCEG